jgi:hypothetical protein
MDAVKVPVQPAEGARTSVPRVVHPAEPEVRHGAGEADVNDAVVEVARRGVHGIAGARRVLGGAEVALDVVRHRDLQDVRPGDDVRARGRDVGAVQVRGPHRVEPHSAGVEEPAGGDHRVRREVLDDDRVRRAADGLVDDGGELHMVTRADLPRIGEQRDFERARTHGDAVGLGAG